jgi:4-hydroxybenzoate polyprenyltransferase
VRKPRRENIDRSASIPVEVILMEATIAYVAVRGSEAVGARPWARPFLAAIGVLAFDAFLDPIAAESYGCHWDSRHEGLGLWRWYWDPSMGAWLGIPLYNFASWFGGAVIAIAFPMLLIDGTRDPLWRRDVLARRSILGRIWARWGDGIALVLVIGVGLLVRTTNPDAAGVHKVDTAVPIFVLVLVATAFFAGLGLHHPKRDNPIDWCLIMPGALLLTFTIAVRCLYGASWEGSAAWPVGLFFFCLTLVIFPYLDTAIDWMWPARQPGEASSSSSINSCACISSGSRRCCAPGRSIEPAPDGATLAVPGRAGRLFHVFAYLQNDVIDLAIDRTQPLRQDDLLVTGRIRPGTAMAIALAQLPISLALVWWAGAPPLAFSVVVVGFALMTIYNLYGKRCPVPPVTDFVQGLAWGSLAILGALVAGGRVTMITLVPAAFGTGFLFLINGVHGGLRDLANDLRCGMKTTAIFFGATPVGDGARSTVALRIFAFSAFATLIVPGALLLASNATGYVAQTWWLVTVSWLVVEAISTYAMWLVVKPIRSGRGRIISAHGLPLLAPPILLFLPAMSGPLRMTCLACFVGPFLVTDPSLETLRAARRAWQSDQQFSGLGRDDEAAFSRARATGEDQIEAAPE